MPICNLHHTTSHDPTKHKQQQIDADARLTGVASLPPGFNSDNDTSSSDEEIAIYDDTTSTKYRKKAAVYDDHSSNNKEVAEHKDFSATT